MAASLWASLFCVLLAVLLFVGCGGPTISYLFAPRGSYAYQYWVRKYGTCYIRGLTNKCDPEIPANYLGTGNKALWCCISTCRINDTCAVPLIKGGKATFTCTPSGWAATTGSTAAPISYSSSERIDCHSLTRSECAERSSCDWYATQEPFTGCYGCDLPTHFCTVLAGFEVAELILMMCLVATHARLARLFREIKQSKKTESGNPRKHPLSAKKPLIFSCTKLGDSLLLYLVIICFVFFMCIALLGLLNEMALHGL